MPLYVMICYNMIFHFRFVTKFLIGQEPILILYNSAMSAIDQLIILREKWYLSVRITSTVNHIDIYKNYTMWARKL